MKLALLELTPHPVYHSIQEYLRLCHSLNFDSDPDYDSLEQCLKLNRFPIPPDFPDIFEDAYNYFRAQLSRPLLSDASEALAEKWARYELAMEKITYVDNQINQQKVGAWFEQWKHQVMRKSLGVAAQLRYALGMRDSAVQKLTSDLREKSRQCSDLVS